MCLQSAADKTSSHNQAQPHQLHQRVVPLFETLDDLNNAGATLARLLNTPWYRRQLRCASSCSADLRTRRPSACRTHKSAEGLLCHSSRSVVS